MASAPATIDHSQAPEVVAPRSLDHELPQVVPQTPPLPAGVRHSPPARHHDPYHAGPSPFSHPSGPVAPAQSPAPHNVTTAAPPTHVPYYPPALPMSYPLPPSPTYQQPGSYQAGVQPQPYGYQPQLASMGYPPDKSPPLGNKPRGGSRVGAVATGAGIGAALCCCADLLSWCC